MTVAPPHPYSGTVIQPAGRYGALTDEPGSGVLTLRPQEIHSVVAPVDPESPG